MSSVYGIGSHRSTTASGRIPPRIRDNNRQQGYGLCGAVKNNEKHPLTYVNFIVCPRARHDDGVHLHSPDEYGCGERNKRQWAASSGRSRINKMHLVAIANRSSATLAGRPVERFYVFYSRYQKIIYWFSKNFSICFLAVRWSNMFVQLVVTLHDRPEPAKLHKTH